MYYPVGTWDSKEHLLQAVGILTDRIKAIQRKFPMWSVDQHLKGRPDRGGLFKRAEWDPADQMYGDLPGSVPMGSAWPGRSCGKCSRSPCVTERSSFPVFLSLLPDVGVLIIPLAGYRAMEGCLASECSSLKEYACLALVGFFPDAGINQFLNCLNKILLCELSQRHQGFRYYKMSKWRSVPGWSQTMTQTELSH